MAGLIGTESSGIDGPFCYELMMVVVMMMMMMTERSLLIDVLLEYGRLLALISTVS